MPGSKREGSNGCSRLGTVTAVQANFYQVRLDDPLDWGSEDLESTNSLLCTRRALLKKLGQSVMVGDRVQVEDPDWTGGRGAISAVLTRQTMLARPPVANATQIFLVFSLAQPEIDPLQLTRFLLTAQQTRMQIGVGLSKADLVPEAVQRDWCDRLQQWGYRAIALSLVNEQGLGEVQEQLQGQLTVLSGPSGVGKSSLINHLIPHLNLRTGLVSQRWHQGRHTTRHTELFNLPQGGLLADTPGFNQPDLPIHPGDLAQLFPEIQRQLNHQSCHFNDCQHLQEPGCVLDKGWERYDHYVQLLEEITAQYDPSLHSGREESQTKTKVRRHGKQEREPRLEQKKYRRESRRSQHQSLADLYAEELQQDRP